MYEYIYIYIINDELNCCKWVSKWKKYYICNGYAILFMLFLNIMCNIYLKIYNHIKFNLPISIKHVISI